jgi:BRO family, N-terminal domain
VDAARLLTFFVLASTITRIDFHYRYVEMVGFFMNTSPDFENIKQINMHGREYWSARDLQEALGYEYWQNFEKVIKKAMTAAASSDVNLKLEDHFSEVTKMVVIGSGAKRKTKDYFLSRRACYLIAQNGDPEKPEIASAQNYFAFTAEVYDMQTARLEQEQRLALRLKVAEKRLRKPSRWQKTLSVYTWRRCKQKESRFPKNRYIHKQSLSVWLLKT